MVQPKTPPISIRLGDERLARIDAYAAEHALSRHLAILVLIDAALGPPAPVKTAVAKLSPPSVPYGSRLKKPKGAKP